MLADPKKTLVILSSKSFTDESLPKFEKWYKINYSADKFTDEQMKNVTEPTVRDNGKKLDLPPPNNMIPAKFDVHPECADDSKIPRCVKQWDDTDLWFKKDDKFKKPKGNIAFKLYTNDLNFGTTQISRVFAEVWKGCLNEYIREFKYMADCAELEFVCQLPIDNISFQWSGYSDTLPVYVRETVERLVKMRDENMETIFNQVKE